MIGALAVLMWGTLAALTVSLHTVPPFQLLTMTFGIAFASGSLWLLITGGPGRFLLLKQPGSFWLLAIVGLFAYHALYFVALRLAPAAEANLINYLWPLLIVLLSALVPGAGRLRAAQLVGAFMGLAGTALLIGGGDSLWCGVGQLLGLRGGILLRARLVVLFGAQSPVRRRSERGDDRGMRRGRVAGPSGAPPA